MQKQRISKPIVVLLSCVIFFSFAFSVRMYLQIRELHVIAGYKAAITEKILENHSALTQKNISLIASWMTFDYINKIFALPPAYLKSVLQISDTHYPYISISKYAKRNALDQAVFLAAIKSAAVAYFVPHA